MPPLRALLVPLLALCAACGADEPERRSPTMFDAPAADASAAPPAPEIPAGAPTVVFLGDSIGAGLHLSEHQAFPAVLQRRLADDAPFELVNASESGRTLSTAVPPPVLRQPCDRQVNQKQQVNRKQQLWRTPV